MQTYYIYEFIDINEFIIYIYIDISILLIYNTHLF